MGTTVDRERLRSLVEPHWRRLYNFVFRLTLDRDRAERYLMDIFAVAAQQLDRAPDTELEIWLLGLANKLLEERLPRARKKVGDYLAPRCEHVNPMNPCRCPARVGTALHKGFIGKVAGEVSLRKAEFPYGRYGTGIGNDDVPMRDIAAIYGNLPEPDPPPDLGDRLLAQLAPAP